MSKRIKLDHWFIDDNELSISLLKYFVKISPFINDNNISFQQTIYHNNQDFINLNFDNLETAINFAEEKVAKANSFDEIIEQHNLIKNVKAKKLNKVK